MKKKIKDYRLSLPLPLYTIRYEVVDGKQVNVRYEDSMGNPITSEEAHKLLEENWK